MCHAADAPALELIQCPSQKLAGLVADELDLSVRCKDREQPWNAVHDQARLTFAFAQRVLRTLPLIDVRQEHAPAIDPSRRIAKRKSVVLEPQIVAVRSPK